MSKVDLPSVVQAQRILLTLRALQNSEAYGTAAHLAEMLDLDLNKFKNNLEKWVNDRKLFSFQCEGGAPLFPLFAFDLSCGLEPVPAVELVLKIFDSHLSVQGIAAWFISINSFLDDQCPKDLIIVDPEWVIDAAHDIIQEIFSQ